MTEEESTLENKSVIISPEMRIIINEMKSDLVLTAAEGMIKIKEQGVREGLSKQEIRTIIDGIFKKELPPSSYFKALPEDLKSKAAQDFARKRGSKIESDSLKKKPLEIPAPEHKIQDAELVPTPRLRKYILYRTELVSELGGQWNKATLTCDDEKILKID